MTPAQALGFRTKTQAVASLREVLARAVPFAPLEGADAALVRAVLDLHASRDTKIGCGVAYVFVAAAPRYAHNRCFWVKRTDGSSTDFSFHEALTPSSLHAKRLVAARQAIDVQVRSFRDGCRDLRCATCGTDQGAMHVDHAGHPFVRLYEAWAHEHGAPALARTSDASADERFFLDADVQSWQQFHAATARFQILCARCNMSKGCR